MADRRQAAEEGEVRSRLEGYPAVVQRPQTALSAPALAAANRRGPGATASSRPLRATLVVGGVPRPPEKPLASPSNAQDHVPSWAAWPTAATPARGRMATSRRDTRRITQVRGERSPGQQDDDGTESKATSERSSIPRSHFTTRLTPNGKYTERRSPRFPAPPPRERDRVRGTPAAPNHPCILILSRTAHG
jgi:hypothetical protein